ncbi:conserved hypothetical protein [Phenylobacterium zucineum HLK1]|uniref:DUF3990 domain-containing protein n=1 Tax=Phenylobacterium zucineum (strain HLK1) TaxID=450851 RepID=B4RFY6_PHEZH|nr:hypothetical protein [Phenylobacterium zucineum]ACG78799.1 conserved hypothetical protein [Phenylobacterium zucineum HLK1]
MSRIVTAYHGTLYEQACAMAEGRFDARPRSKARWLGSGLYFFEGNPEAAAYYATRRAMQKNGRPGILRADIDLTTCLDLTATSRQEVVRTAHRIMVADGSIDRLQITQKPFELQNGDVRAGWFGDYKDYGRNELDFAVIERAVQLAREQQNIVYETVRGAFIEGGPLYKDSWLYSGAHVAITVREPPARMSNLRALELD